MEELYKGHDWQILLDSASLPDGREKRTARAKRPDSVHIIACKTDDTILMLREYRPFYKNYIWMIPSGRVDKEIDHDSAAQRELQEETGYKANVIQRFCKTNYSESLIATNYVYIASDLEESPLPQDDDEEIEVHECTLEQALDNVLGSNVIHTASAFALLHYMRELKR